MRLAAKFTQEELDEAHKLAKGPFRGLRHVVGKQPDLPLLLQLMLLAIGAMSLWHHECRMAGGVLAVLLLWVAGMVRFRARRARGTELLELNRDLPEFIDTLPDGIRWQETDGAHAFWPWSRFKEVKANDYILWIKPKGNNAPSPMIPTSQLSPTERSELKNEISSALARSA